MKISKVDALEVLDSRGFPTLRVFLTISHRNKEYQGVATVPSGASRGKFEALEKRDNDRKRYFGKGQKLSVELIRRNLAKKLVGMKVQTIQAFDDRLRELDNTPQKSKLGGNVTIGLSMACARAIAISRPTR